ncbi:MAG: preprotein translocase subunit SecA [Planctomycetota bacterium]|nr:preprotein translocase subunit SecA [Planctomycetota bacterium]
MAGSQGIPFIGPLLNRIVGTRNDRFVRKYTSRTEAINRLEPEIRRLDDAGLRAKFVAMREKRDNGVKGDDLLVEAFAVAREAMDRSVGIRNVLNPEAGFDATLLPEAAKRIYDEVRAEAEAMPVLLPRTLATTGGGVPEGEPDVDDEFLGHPDPVPGWRRVNIPIALYDAVRELYPESRPPFRARPFDVQLIGAMVLSGGKIAEMKTGEGKTIVAPLATYLACLERQQVHVITVNDYLVQRDRDWVFPFFHALGLKVGAIHPMHMQPEETKRWMYRCNVVYGTTSEFGFDYLRDNMKRAVDQQVQRKRQFAIVDEVDSILIDEARTPLIISGPAHDDQPRYELADKLARHLVEKQKPWQELEDQVEKCKQRIKGLEGDIRQARDKSLVPDLQKQLEAAKGELPNIEADRDKHTQYYELEMDKKQCHLSHDGISEAQREAGIGSFYVDQNMDVPHLLEQSLRAHVVYLRDRDYVIMDVDDRATGKREPTIVIVDTFTGRPMIGRQWSDGLHQAVECKEGVPIKQETQTIATVTIQNFYKMYKRLSGMTGTADTEAQEFRDIYKLDVVSIPTNKPVIRDDFDDLMFLRSKDKWDTIVDEIKAFHDVGRPILVGTTSVEKSEMLAQMLAKKYQIRHEVLNAKQHEREAHIVEGAGGLGAVMIATNMAGRGTDIKLLPVSREQLLDHWLRRSIASRGLSVDSSDEELRENVYRKIAPAELGMPKREAEAMEFEELELKLLRHWANKNTWISPNKVDSLDAEALREALDSTGRCLLHRLRWFETVEDIGGLHVIGTERHESRRIDNQLRGRSGRQGDKGSSRFFVSLDDDLMKMFAGETTMKVLSRLGMKEGDAIEHPMLSKSVERAQRKVEERNFEVRKNILEYDEVMEHQRQEFYGLRQRVLEGREVRSLIFDYISEAIDDASGLYLDPEYPAECVAEYAREQFDFSVPPEKLRGKDGTEMDIAVRRIAAEEARHMIDVTLGEYIPIEGSEISVDFDSAGLVEWAKSRFEVEVDVAQVRSGGLAERNEIYNMLCAAANERIETADLPRIAVFTEEEYGAKKLIEWCKSKFGIELELDEVLAAIVDEERSPKDLILERAENLYDKREVEYPIEFVMQLTMSQARQNPQQALAQLAGWAKRRFGLDWTPETIQKTPPAQIREQLLEASRKFVDEDQIEKEVQVALACKDDETLDAHLTERFDMTLPEAMRFLEPDERPDAVRALVENLLRTELLYLERSILLEVLDTTWKDHLYTMDQLRDGIGFRSFSQLDPRIEYKREGAKLFNVMDRNVRDKVTDFIFKARLNPNQVQPAGGGGGGGGGAPAPQGTPPGRASAPAAGSGGSGGNIVGPGLA